MTGQIAPLGLPDGVFDSLVATDVTGAKLGYLSQEQDVLLPHWNAVDAVRDVHPMSETEARSFLHFFLFAGEDSLRRVRDLSYGERTRLMLARLVAGGANVLLMNEPLNHLDVTSREKFEQAILNFSGAVLTIAHDRAFVAQIAQKLWYSKWGDSGRDYATSLDFSRE